MPSTTEWGTGTPGEWEESHGVELQATAPADGGELLSRHLASDRATLKLAAWKTGLSLAGYRDGGVPVIPQKIRKKEDE